MEIRAFERRPATPPYFGAQCKISQQQQICKKIHIAHSLEWHSRRIRKGKIIFNGMSVEATCLLLLLFLFRVSSHRRWILEVHDKRAKRTTQNEEGKKEYTRKKNVDKNENGADVSSPLRSSSPGRGRNLLASNDIAKETASACGWQLHQKPK